MGESMTSDEYESAALDALGDDSGMIAARQLRAAHAQVYATLAQAEALRDCHAAIETLAFQLRSGRQ